MKFGLGPALTCIHFYQCNTINYSNWASTDALLPKIQQYRTFPGPVLHHQVADRECLHKTSQFRADTQDHWGPEAELPSQQGALPRLISGSTKNEDSSAAPRVSAHSQQAPACCSAHLLTHQAPSLMQVIWTVTSMHKAKSWRSQAFHDKHMFFSPKALPAMVVLARIELIFILVACIMLWFGFVIKAVFSLHPWQPWLLTPPEHMPAAHELSQLEHLN